MLGLWSCVEIYITEDCSNGAVRLVGGPNEFEGRVEVCLEGQWGRWCSGNVDATTIEARSVCSQIGGTDLNGTIFTVVHHKTNVPLINAGYNTSITQMNAS